MEAIVDIGKLRHEEKLAMKAWKRGKDGRYSIPNRDAPRILQDVSKIYALFEWQAIKNV